VTIQQLLETVIKKDASDLHLVVGQPPMYRVDGDLTAIPGEEILSLEAAQTLIFDLLTSEQKELILVNKELDFSFGLGDVARFRVNAYYQKGYLSASLRLIPSNIKTIEDLQLPKSLHNFAKMRQGFVLVTGPTGHGKSTTLASIINEINLENPMHILTIEDPIEYVYPRGRALVSQRELHLDTHSWDIALRSALREDTNVVLVGEMRDYETIAAALTIAETGHLVFATLHTNSASQSIDRIIDVFPEHQQAQIRTQLANILEGVISQRLVPIIGGGRKAVVEVMLATSAIRNTIREGKTYQIDNVIATSGDVGMISLEKSLVNLVREGKLTLEEAQAHSLKPEEIVRLVRG